MVCTPEGDGVVLAPIHRTVRVRLLPQSRSAAHQLAGTAGACRFVWNHFLAQQQHAYRCWREYRIGPPPRVSFFSLGKAFTQLRNAPDTAWLQDYSFAEVRYSLKYLADAYQACFKGGGHPRFKRKHARQDGFTIPDGVSVQGARLRVPRLGWMQLVGSNLYADQHPLQARLRQEGTAARPKWYAYITYAVPPDQVRQGAQSGVLGLDRNVGQVTDSAGRVYRLTDSTRLDAKVRRKQRHLARKRRGSVRHRRLGGQLTQLRRKQKRIRSHDTHRVSRQLADQAHTVVVEDLHTAAMTRSARGTVDNPGTNVKAKAGLNRSILASNWAQLQQRLAYKCGQLLKVAPRYTSQTCHHCGHVAPQNRKTQAQFQCVRCGVALNADWNAALNILGRHDTRPVARGTGATARREAFPLGTSLTREHDMPESVYYGI